MRVEELLAFLMLLNQLPNMNTWQLLLLSSITVGIIFLIKKSPIPAPFIALVIMLVVTMNMDLERLSDTGTIAFSGINFQLNLSF